MAITVGMTVTMAMIGMMIPWCDGHDMVMVLLITMVTVVVKMMAMTMMVILVTVVVVIVAIAGGMFSPDKITARCLLHASIVIFMAVILRPLAEERPQCGNERRSHRYTGLSLRKQLEALLFSMTLY
jgi:membrane protein implicated in regulation of membrane protease activity